MCGGGVCKGKVKRAKGRNQNRFQWLIMQVMEGMKNKEKDP